MRLLLAVALAVLSVLLFIATGQIALRQEMGTGARAAVAAVLLVAVMTISVFLPVVAFGEMGDLNPRDLHLGELFLGHYVLIAFLIGWWALRCERPPLAAFLGLKWEDWSTVIGVGVRAGLTAWLVAITMNLTIGGLLGSAGAMQGPHAIPDIVIWFAELGVASKLLIVGMAMTVEEAFFRGFLQQRLGLWPSSILFAFGHFSYGLPFLVVGVFMVSLVLGRTFAKTQNLLPCIIGHGVVDAIQLFVILPAVVHVGVPPAA